jgi:hypothetical protein
MNRIRTAAVSAMSLTLALWIGDAHAADHGKGNAHAGSSGHPAPHNAGGPPPSAPAPVHSAGVVHSSSGGSSNGGSSSSSRPPTVFHNNSSSSAPSFGAVQHRGPSNTPASVPFSNPVSAPLHAGNVAPKLNVSTPANAPQLPQVRRKTRFRRRRFFPVR